MKIKFTDRDLMLSYEHGREAYEKGLGRTDTTAVPKEKFDVGIHMGEFQNGWWDADDGMDSDDGIYNPHIDVDREFT